VDTILPERLTAPPSSATPAISRLPDEILREGSKRLQTASLLYSAGILIVFFGVNLAKGSVRPELFIEPRSLIAGAGVLLGLGFFAIARYANIRLDRLMDLGLVFLVVSTLFLSLSNTWDAYPAWEEEFFGVPLLIPWECV
jgi:hypothetical protein